MTNEIVALEIADVQIRSDEHGRYCLNDLHRAAGGEDRHKPGNWLRSQQTQDLVAALESEIAQIRAIEAIQGLGTFVTKELVYAYAMWVSPKFHLTVIRTFDAVQQAPQTTGDALVAMAMAYREHERRIMALEVEQDQAKQAIAELLGGDDYATAKGYARTNNLPADRNTLNRVGRRAAAMCRDRGVRIGRVTDEVWGEVNSYPRQMLAAAFSEMM